MLSRVKFPPHKLQFDTQGTIWVEDDRIVIEGGEAKSSLNSKPNPLHIKYFY